MNHYRLNNGVEIPVLGFGTWKAADGEEAYQAVLAALKAGYRHEYVTKTSLGMT